MTDTMTASRDGQALSAATLADETRHAILVGEFNPGQRLVESDLSARFGATRGTVREALALLVHEGLVVREANRGAWVRPISREEALEITEVRSVLEGLCAYRAATMCTAADKKQLKDLGKRLKAAVDQGDVVTYSRLTEDVHLQIREIAGQQVASDVLNRLRYQSVRFQFSVALLPGRPTVGLKEHLDIIDAVISGDPTRAERTMRRHLLSVVDAIKQLPDTLPSHRAFRSAADQASLSV
jgi:DNA-binding GntR family transcriptional regulator